MASRNILLLHCSSSFLARPWPWVELTDSIRHGDMGSSKGSWYASLRCSESNERFCYCCEMTFVAFCRRTTTWEGGVDGYTRCFSGVRLSGHAMGVWVGRNVWRAPPCSAVAPSPALSFTKVRVLTTIISNERVGGSHATESL